MDTGNQCLVNLFLKESHVREALELNNRRKEVSLGIFTDFIQDTSLNVFIVDVAKFLQEFTLKVRLIE